MEECIQMDGWIVFEKDGWMDYYNERPNIQKHVSCVYRCMCKHFQEDIIFIIMILNLNHTYIGL